MRELILSSLWRSPEHWALEHRTGVITFAKRATRDERLVLPSLISCFVVVSLFS